MPTCPILFEPHLGDARMAELRVLSWAEQHGEPQVGANLPVPWRDLVISLVSNESLSNFSYERSRAHFVSTGHGSSPAMGSPDGVPGSSRLERAVVTAKVNSLDGLHQGLSDVFRLTHAGRVRLSELKQALRSGREREPFGILWDVRHWEQDLAIALLDASVQAPLCVAYMDMNGLKNLNDTYGHETGDKGLRAYFQAVAAAIGDVGQAYRLGGDEVLVVMPRSSASQAERHIERACRHLMNERLEVKGNSVVLSIAAGLVTVTVATKSPTDVRSAADQVQYRAKEQSRKTTPRPSVIAQEDVEAVKIIPT